MNTMEVDPVTRLYRKGGGTSTDKIKVPNQLDFEVIKRKIAEKQTSDRT